MNSATKATFVVHASAIVDEPATIGEGTRIWHFSHVMAGAVIGSNCSLGQNVFVASGVRIGNDVKIQNNVSIYEGVELADDVFCGPSLVFTNVGTPRSGVPRNTSAHYVRTVVCRGATLGANATIVCGVTIGAYAFVGAGSVVTRDVPSYGLTYGNPARLAGYACRCGPSLTFEGAIARCVSCGRAYRRAGFDVVCTSET